jgi:hypothetical protein
MIDVPIAELLDDSICVLDGVHRRYTVAYADGQRGFEQLAEGNSMNRQQLTPITPEG